MKQCRENIVYPVTRVDVRIGGGPLDYAVKHREAIAHNWQKELQKQPSLFNGELYLAPEAHFENGILEAKFIRNCYATLMYWRKDRELMRPWHIFGTGVIVSADNILIAARMGGNTAAAFRIYFPAGSIDDHDVRNGRVDYDFNMQREVKEETGLDLQDALAEEGYWLVTGNRSIALFKRYYFNESAEDLMAQIRQTLVAQEAPELEDVIAISGAGMMGEATSAYVRAFADWHFSNK